LEGNPLNTAEVVTVPKVAGTANVRLAVPSVTVKILAAGLVTVIATVLENVLVAEAHEPWVVTALTEQAGVTEQDAGAG
jgi:hypothetical protein